MNNKKIMALFNTNKYKKNKRQKVIKTHYQQKKNSINKFKIIY